MIDSVMFWNEPNNMSHWDFTIDTDWCTYARMTKLAADAVRRERPGLTRVLGGISPIDPGFIANMRGQGVLDHLDVVAVHGFPLDWNNWKIDEWPQQIDEIRNAAGLPVWVTEVGASTFGADQIQVFGMERTAELLLGSVERVHWYSLFDLPKAWPATTRHRESEGSSYYRHFSMGLLREDGTPKPALDAFARYSPGFDLCQWFHFEDDRLEDAVRWLRRLGVRRLRTGLSWSDSVRPGGIAWMDRMMSCLDEFDVTATLCFTPPGLGVCDDHTSPPRDPADYADFADMVVSRYT